MDSAKSTVYLMSSDCSDDKNSEYEISVRHNGHSRICRDLNTVEEKELVESLMRTKLNSSRRRQVEQSRSDTEPADESAAHTRGEQ